MKEITIKIEVSDTDTCTDNDGELCIFCEQVSPYTYCRLYNKELDRIEAGMDGNSRKCEDCLGRE